MILSSPELKYSQIVKISLLLLVTGAILIISQIFYSNNDQSIPTLSIVSENDLQPRPVKVKISNVSVDASIVDLGLNRDGTLEVPKGSMEVGWYTKSPSPGALGPSILVGHLDSIRGPAVFSRLDELKAGDMVEVERDDGSVAVFKVNSSEKYSQNAFPSEKVYGSIDHAGIRLITCSGKYNHLTGRYSDNLVVYGTLDKILEK